MDQTELKNLTTKDSTDKISRRLFALEGLSAVVSTHTRNSHPFAQRSGLWAILTVLVQLQQKVDMVGSTTAVDLDFTEK